MCSKPLSLSRLFALLNCAAILCCSQACAREFFVNNVDGNDSNDGFASAPFKSIQQAANLADAGDSIFLMPTKEPYRQPQVSFRKSGTANMPIVLDGRGAILSGLQVSMPEQWKELGGGMYSTRFVTDVPIDATWYEKFNLVFFDQKPGLKSVSKDKIEPYGYFLSIESTANENNFFIKLPNGKTPKNTAIMLPQHDHTGLNVSGDHVTIKNLTSAYCLGDGFSTTDGHDIIFDNVRGCFNFNQGLGNHGSNVVVKNSTFDHNKQFGARDELAKCESRYEDCAFVENHPAGVECRGSKHRFVRCYFYNNSEIQAQSGKGANIDLDNSYFHSPGNIGVHLWQDQGSIKNCTFDGLSVGIDVLDAAAVCTGNAFKSCSMNMQVEITGGLDAEIAAGNYKSNANLFVDGSFRIEHQGPELTYIEFAEKTGLDTNSVSVASITKADSTTAPIKVGGKPYGSNLTPALPQKLMNLQSPDPRVQSPR